ncbi:MAG: hypothetical protein KKD46_06575 [Euryarchaeota archaeon]|nr:hypothetical protein [Euryarchaeota archaeon]MBU4340564.1 hypothetical protein [Euryarchaeota archaeon]MCG2736025.1 hypothetical protein [Candidatus Methanoperedenaceae archaeon]
MQEKRQFTMTEWKYLPEKDYRIALWRNTIQLFHEYKKSNFIGPFKAAGFNYVVDRPFLTRQGESRQPDIISSGETGWLVLELTANQKSKEAQLEKYKTIDSRYLGNYGLYPHESPPDIICSRFDFVDDGSFCQIFVKDFFDLKNEEQIENQHLKTELIKAKGMGLDLRKLPEIPITLLPEMNNPQEIRRGLIEIVMQLFAPNSDGKTPIQMVDEGLERLIDKIGVNEKHALMDRVKFHMEILIDNHLSGYLEFKDNAYRATDKFKQHHKTLESVASRLKEWAGPSPQRTLEDERFKR